jgi:hypothetical protein
MRVLYLIGALVPLQAVGLRALVQTMRIRVGQLHPELVCDVAVQAGLQRVIIRRPVRLAVHQRPNARIRVDPRTASADACGAQVCSGNSEVLPPVGVGCGSDGIVILLSQKVPSQGADIRHAGYQAVRQLALNVQIVLRHVRSAGHLVLFRFPNEDQGDCKSREWIRKTGTEHQVDARRAGK